MEGAQDTNDAGPATLHSLSQNGAHNERALLAKLRRPDCHRHGRPCGRHNHPADRCLRHGSVQRRKLPADFSRTVGPVDVRVPVVGSVVVGSAGGGFGCDATGVCKLGTADADGGNARLVPVFGDMNSGANPQQRRSCDPYSVSPDGSLIAVNQRTGDQPDGDVGRDLVANAIVDTRTGSNVTLPVTGTITAVLFQPNGDLLVRSSNGGANQLTLLGADHTIKSQVTEPASVKNARLLAYTTN